MGRKDAKSGHVKSVVFQNKLPQNTQQWQDATKSQFCCVDHQNVDGSRGLSNVMMKWEPWLVKDPKKNVWSSHKDNVNMSQNLFLNYRRSKNALMSPRRSAHVKEPIPRKFRGRSSRTGVTLPLNPRSPRNQLHPHTDNSEKTYKCQKLIRNNVWSVLKIIKNLNI